MYHPRTREIKNLEYIHETRKKSGKRRRIPLLWLFGRQLLMTCKFSRVKWRTKIASSCVTKEAEEIRWPFMLISHENNEEI